MLACRNSIPTGELAAIDDATARSRIEKAPRREPLERRDVVDSKRM